MARILEHEHFGHFSMGLLDSDAGLPFPVNGRLGPLEETFGNLIREELNLPRSITYGGNGPNGGEGFWLGS